MTTRLSATERAQEILRAATEEFAEHGYHGASTSKIAARLEISQPYIFKLFGTKKDLYLATLAHVYDRVEQTFERAAHAPDDDCDRLASMGRAYIATLDERAYLQLILQSFTSSADPDIQSFVSRRYTEIFERVQTLAGVDAVAARTFMATGLLLTVTAVAGLPTDVFWPEHAAQGAHAGMLPFGAAR